MAKQHPVWAYLLLVVIFIASFSFRILLTAETTHPLDEQSYFNLRQAQYIKENGVSMFNDDLSYGGRNILFPPFFHYILALLFLFGNPIHAGMILTAMLGAAIVIPVFLVSERVAKDPESSVMAALLAGFIPIIIEQTTARISSYSLIMFLVGWMIYLFLKHQFRLARYGFIILLCLLTLTHSSVLVFIFGLVLYCMFVYLESLTIKKTEIELMIFSLVFVLWGHLIFYKKLFLLHGPNLIWQNIPDSVLSLYFSQVSILQVAYLVGFVPFFAGIIVTYRYLFRLHHKPMHLLIGFALATGALLFFKMIEMKLGLLFFSLTLCMLFPKAYSRFKKYIFKTKIPYPKWFPMTLALILIIGTAVIPSYAVTENDIHNSEMGIKIQAMEWIRENTPKDAIIFSELENGHLITAVAERKNFVDDYFTFIEDAEKRMSDHNLVFNTQSKTLAIEIFDKYKIKYLAVAEELPFIEEDCFNKIYDHNYLVYEVTCHLEN